MSKEKKSKSYKKRIKKQKEIQEDSLTKEVEAGSNVNTAASEGMSALITFFGAEGVYFTFIALLQCIAETISLLSGKGHISINISAFLGAFGCFVVLALWGPLAFKSKIILIKLYGGSLILAFVSNLCMIAECDTDATDFSIFTILVTVVSIIVNIMVSKAVFKDESEQEKELTKKAGKRAKKTERNAEQIRGDLFTAIVSGIVMILTLVLCINYGGSALFDGLRLIIPSYEVNANCLLGSIFALILYFICYPIGSLETKIACINGMFAAVVAIIAEIVWHFGISRTRFLLAASFLLASIGYLNAFIRMLLEIISRKRSSNRADDIAQDDKKAKVERNLDFVYTIEFEVESDVLKDAYNELLKSGDFEGISGMDIAFECVETYITRMKFCKRRPVFYNLTSSLSSGYDNKMEQKIKGELISKIQGRLYLQT